jgi:hypothetical protein
LQVIPRHAELPKSRGAVIWMRSSVGRERRVDLCSFGVDELELVS